MKQPELEKLINFKETQALLGISSATLYRKLYSGEILGRKMGGKWIFYPRELQRYLDQLPSNRKKIKLAR